MLPLSNTDQYTLSLIVVRGILDVYTHYCRTVITGKYVDFWIHGNISLKILCTDYNAWKQPLYSKYIVIIIIRYLAVCIVHSYYLFGYFYDKYNV